MSSYLQVSLITNVIRIWIGSCDEIEFEIQMTDCPWINLSVNDRVKGQVHFSERQMLSK